MFMIYWQLTNTGNLGFFQPSDGGKFITSDDCNFMVGG
jgi:hypothetical protein